jgi:hypothetical protein
MAREVPANRSKANEAVTSIFIGANVTPKILLTSNISLFSAKIYDLRLENTDFIAVFVFERGDRLICYSHTELACNISNRHLRRLTVSRPEPGKIKNPN